MLMKRTVGTVMLPRRRAQTVVIPANISVLGSAAIGTFVGTAIGGLVGAAVGAIIGAIVGAISALISSGKVKELRVILERTGTVSLVIRT